MVEILVMLGVIRWFTTTAKTQGKNGSLWGFIGAASYYGPVLLIGTLIFPEIVRGKVTPDNQFSYIALGIATSVTAGIICCFFARQMLLSRSEKIYRAK